MQALASALLAIAIGLLILHSLYLIWRSRRRARRFSRKPPGTR